MPAQITVQPGIVEVTRTGKPLKYEVYSLSQGDTPLGEVRIESGGWKFWQQRYSLTIGGQQYQLDPRRAQPGTHHLVDSSGQIIAIETDRQTLEHAGQRYRLEGWTAIDFVSNAQGQRLLEMDWESGGGPLKHVRVSQPIGANLLAVAVTFVLLHQSAGGGGG